jgi:hypothetical protein
VPHEGSRIDPHTASQSRPLFESSEQDLAFQLNVNVFGPYRVRRVFAPILIESRERAVAEEATWPRAGQLPSPTAAITLTSTNARKCTVP